MMIPPSPESEVKSSATIAHSTSASTQWLLAAVLRRQVDHRARDAGIERHASEQRAEDHRHVDRRKRNGAVGNDAAQLRKRNAGGQRHRDAMSGTAMIAGHPAQVHQRRQRPRRRRRISSRAHGLRLRRAPHRATASGLGARRMRRSLARRTHRRARSPSAPQGDSARDCSRDAPSRLSYATRVRRAARDLRSVAQLPHPVPAPVRVRARRRSRRYARALRLGVHGSHLGGDLELARERIVPPRGQETSRMPRWRAAAARLK